MSDKSTIAKFIKDNPEINFEPSEVNDLVNKIEKSIKRLKEFGSVDVGRIDKDGNLYIQFTDINRAYVEMKIFFEVLNEEDYDDYANLIIEVSNRLNPVGNEWMATMSVVVPPSPAKHYGHVSVYDWGDCGGYNGTVCEIFVSFRQGFAK